MLSTAVIKNAGQASSYFMERDDYYAKEGALFEKLSTWHGKGAKILGLEGCVDKKVYNKLLQGSLPNGEQIGATKSGEIKHRCGFDLTLSVPKSWSIAHYVTKEAIFSDITEKAAKLTADFIERDCAMASRFENGKQFAELTGNLVLAFHYHRLSREMEMQDHVHMNVMNMTQRADKTWRALKSDDPRKAIHDYSDGFLERVRARKQTYGDYFSLQVAHLAQKNGFKLRFDEDGKWELDAIPEGMIKEFSTRRKQIKQHMSKLGYFGAKAAEAAALASRKAKQKLSRKQIESKLNERLAKFPEITLADLKNEYSKSLTQNESGEQSLADKAIEYAIWHLSEKAEVITKEKLIVCAMRHYKAKPSASSLLSAIQRKEESKELFAISDSGCRHFVSATHIKMEKEVLSFAQDLKKIYSPIIKSKEQFKIWQSRINNSLTSEQKSVVENIMRFRSLTNIVDGRCGSGKSTLIPILSKGVMHARLAPIVLCMSKKEAEDLEVTTRAKCMSVAGYINQVKVKQNIAKSQKKTLKLSDQVLIVDNAHRLSTKQGHQLLKIQNEHKNRAIFLHDSKQPQSLQPGNFMTLVQQAGLNVQKMHASIRNPCSLSAQRFEVQDKNERLNKLSSDFVESQISSPDKHALILGQNKTDVAELNSQVQQKLLSKGLLGKKSIQAMNYQPVFLTAAQLTQASQYKKGQLISFNKNYTSLGVKKGSYYGVESVCLESNKVNLQVGDKLVAWDPDKVGGRREGVVRVFLPKALKLHQGDRVITSSTCEKIAKGRSFTISEIKKNTVVLSQGKNRALKVDVGSPILNHLDLGYAKTAFAASTDNPHVIFSDQASSTRLTNAKQYYKILGQAKEEVKIYTDDVVKHSATLKRYKGDSAPVVEHLFEKISQINLKHQKINVTSAEIQQQKSKAVSMVLTAKTNQKEIYQSIENFRNTDNKLTCRSKTTETPLKKVIDKIEQGEALKVKQERVLSRYLSDEKNVYKSMSQKLKAMIKYCGAELSDKESVFTEFNLIQEILIQNKRFGAKLDMSSFSSQLEKLVAKKIFIPCKIGATHAYTTRKTLNLEANIAQNVRQLKGSKEPFFKENNLEPKLKTWQKANKTLTASQKLAVETLLTTKDQLTLINGLAGVGKTTMLEAVNPLAAKENIKLVGLAPTHAATSQLQERGIESHTLDSYLGLLAKSHKEGKFNPKAKEILVLDEASMASSQKINQLLTLTKDSNVSMAFIGDIKQLPSIEQGKMFWMLQKMGTETVLVDEIVRQKNYPEYLNIIKKIYQSDFAGAIKDMDKAGLVYDDKRELDMQKKSSISDKFRYLLEGKMGSTPATEQETKVEKLRQIAEKRIAKLSQRLSKLAPEKRDNTCVITPANNHRNAYNKMHRTDLRRLGELGETDYKTTVLVNADLSVPAKAHAMNYKKGQVIYFHYPVQDAEIKSGDYLTVEGADLKRNFVILTNEKGEQTGINASRFRGSNSKKISVYEQEERCLSVQDRIRWRYTDKKLGRINMQEAVITHASSNKVTAKLANGVEQDLALNTMPDAHWDHAYASTVYTEQGNTKQFAALYMLSTQRNLASQPGFLVAMTRAIENGVLVTDNKEKLIQRLEANRGIKTSALEVLGCKSDKFLIKKASTLSPQKTEIAQPILARKTQYNLSEINELLHQNAESVAMNVLGKPKRRNGTNLFYGSKNGSLAVTISGQYQGTWKDFDTGEKGNMLGLVQKEMNLDFKNALEEAAKLVNYIPGNITHVPQKTQEKSRLPISTELTDYQKSQIQRAKKIANESVPIKETLAEKYLTNTRGIKQNSWPSDVRFHAGIYSKINGGKHPALVLVARDKKQNIQSIQAIYLDEETQNKADVAVKKQTIGTPKGAMFCANSQEKSNTAIICEGPEDALSIAKSITNTDVFACFGKSNFVNLPKVNDYQKVLLALDNDGKKPEEMPNIIEAAKQIANAETTVLLAQPKNIKQDYNDMLKDKFLGEMAVKSTLCDAKKYDISTGKLSKSKQNFGTKSEQKISKEESFQSIDYEPKSSQSQHFKGNFSHEKSISDRKISEKELEV